MTTTPPQITIVEPDNGTLSFTLSKAVSDTPKTVLKLSYSGNLTVVAFKVKTTQPRRYLVRPNQGLIRSGDSAEIQIFLVDKDRQQLLQSYDKLGFSQEALNQACKDKFLVQCSDIPEEYKQVSSNFTGASNTNKEVTEQLTSMWNFISQNKLPVHNTKLLVQHLVVTGGVGDSASGLLATQEQMLAVADDSAAEIVAKAKAGSQQQNTSNSQLASMSNESLIQEVSSLRKKYDELIAFSVNLTAERDILNNSLEQTKRDLVKANRAASRASNKKSSAGSSSSSFGSSLKVLVLSLFLGLGIGYYYGSRVVSSDGLNVGEGEL